MGTAHQRSEEERLALYAEANSLANRHKLLIGRILQRRFPNVRSPRTTAALLTLWHAKSCWAPLRSPQGFVDMRRQGPGSHLSSLSASARSGVQWARVSSIASECTSVWCRWRRRSLRAPF